MHNNLNGICIVLWAFSACSSLFAFDALLPSEQLVSNILEYDYSRLKLAKKEKEKLIKDCGHPAYLTIKLAAKLIAATLMFYQAQQTTKRWALSFCLLSGAFYIWGQVEFFCLLTFLDSKRKIEKMDFLMKCIKEEIKQKRAKSQPYGNLLHDFSTEEV